MSTETSFNANQQAVVDAGDSPLLVVAGPGAGKTTVLRARIERILRSSEESRFRILGITFTTVAARAVKKRLSALPEAERERTEIGTFHAFATRVLQQHGSHIGVGTSFTIVSAWEDRLAILGEVLKERASPSDPRGILPLLTEVLERAVSIEDIGERVSAVRAIPDFADIVEGYVSLSLKRAQIDFPLLIHLCIRLFRAVPGVAKQLRRAYKYICVDEFQDTNDSQFELLKLLVGETPQGLLLLADQDQLVYQWNGASPWRLQEAQQRFSMEVLLLPTSFRCPDAILEAANKLISHNSSRFVKPTFTSSSGLVGNIYLRALPDEAAEREWLAAQLAVIPQSERERTAVLSRARKMLDAAMARCVQLGLPVASPVARYEFESAPLKMLHNMLRLVVAPTSHSAVEKMCAAFYEMTGRNPGAATLRARAEAEEQNVLALFFEDLRPAAASEEFRVLADSVSRDLLAGKGIRQLTVDFFQWAERVAESRAKTAYKASYDVERELWDDFERRHRSSTIDGARLREFVQDLDLESKAPSYPDHISFLTAHGAKGLEFSRVFVIGAADGQFPTYQAVKLGDLSDPMEEERRSFFVAITRCSGELTISYARSYAGRQAIPSRFIAEMGI